MVTTASLTKARAYSQNSSQKANISGKDLDDSFARTPPELLRALNFSSVPLRSTVDISQEEDEKRHAIDKKIGASDLPIFLDL